MSYLLASQLKAELERKKSELSAKDTANSNTKRRRIEEAKSTSWIRENRGVKDRSQRDLLSYEDKDAGRSFEKSQRILEQKAQIYRRLRSGHLDTLTEGQRAGLLVDFESMDDNSADWEEDDGKEAPKRLQGGPRHGTDNDQECNSTSDDMVKSTDEFGRTVWVSPSEAKRRDEAHHPSPPTENEVSEVIRGAEFFPVYHPDPEKLARLRAERLAEEAKPLNVHYDASKEARDKGVAYYKFSADQSEREQQMRELHEMREDTKIARNDRGRKGQDSLPSSITGQSSQKGRYFEN